MTPVSVNLDSNTVCARLTPAIPSAIATISVRGPKAEAIVGELIKFSVQFSEAFPLGRVRYGLWNADLETDAAEQVVVCRVAEQLIEIHCHGGNAVCQMIVEDLQTAGCECVSAAEFPIDFKSECQREAAIDLQRATSDRVAAILLDQFNGALDSAVATIEERFRVHGAAAVREDVLSVLKWSELGQHLIEPWKVVLAGPPNAGKSSLVNAIAGSERSIVHAEPGTTRDWVEVLTAIDGWPVSLSDTAGIRDSVDEIEAEGIRRAVQQVELADLVLFVVDATVGWTATHERLKAIAEPKRSLVVWNKVDLLHGDYQAIPSDVIQTSANGLTAQQPHIESLLKAISTSLVPVDPKPQAAIPFRERHLIRLQQFL